MAKAKTSDPARDRLAEVAVLFNLASNPNRFCILLILCDGERHVGGIAEDLVSTQPVTSNHLSLLRRGGLVKSRLQGHNKFYRLTETGETLAAIAETLAAL
jgi:ArsR family transcriptional regulator, virulence genes transcriptional regulator